MSEKIIEIDSGKHKAFEILSLLVHFYNEKYILEDLYAGYSQDIFRFTKIEKRRDLVRHENFVMPNYLIKVDTYDHNNYFYYYTPSAILKTNLIFEYDKKQIRIVYNYNHEAELTTVSINYGRQNTYNVLKSEPENDSDKFISAQNRMINRLQFFELYRDHILSKIIIKNDFNTIYRFKKYIKSIIDYKSENCYKTLREMCKFIDSDIMTGKIYSMNNFLSIKKSTQDRVGLSIGNMTRKTIDINSPNFDSFFDIFIPVFEHLGGLKELQNIVLRQRLMEE